MNQMTKIKEYAAIEIKGIIKQYAANVRFNGTVTLNVIILKTYTKGQ